MWSKNIEKKQQFNDKHSGKENCMKNSLRTLTKAWCLINHQGNLFQFPWIHGESSRYYIFFFEDPPTDKWLRQRPNFMCWEGDQNREWTSTETLLLSSQRRACWKVPQALWELSEVFQVDYYKALSKESTETKFKKNLTKTKPLKTATNKRNKQQIK